MIRSTLHRRSFLARVAGGASFAGSLALIAGDAAAAQVTDCDYGAGADPAGRGSGRTPRTGVTDNDAGANADRASCGRGTSRVSPQDPSQPGATGVTDSDTGANADPIGRGRGPRPNASGETGITDSDIGPNADPVGRGRGRPNEASCAQMRARIRALEDESQWMLNDEAVDYLRGRLQEHDRLYEAYRTTPDIRRVLEIQRQMNENIQAMRRIAGEDGQATVDRARTMVRENEQNRPRFHQIIAEIDELRRRAGRCP